MKRDGRKLSSEQQLLQRQNAVNMFFQEGFGSAPRIVRNWLDGFWLRSYAESAKYKPETIHETH